MGNCLHILSLPKSTQKPESDSKPISDAPSEHKLDAIPSPPNPESPEKPSPENANPQIHSLDVIHHAVYGYGSSAPPDRRVIPSDWDTKPFKSPVSAPWDLPLTAPQISRLKLGFCPNQMEEKWFVCTVDEGNEMRIGMWRSWTGKKVVEVLVGLDGNGDGGGRIKEVVWEKRDMKGKMEERVEGVKETVREVCSWVLGVQLSDDE